jgi:hypothetical protein
MDSGLFAAGADTQGLQGPAVRRQHRPAWGLPSRPRLSGLPVEGVLCPIRTRPCPIQAVSPVALCQSDKCHRIALWRTGGLGKTWPPGLATGSEADLISYRFCWVSVGNLPLSVPLYSICYWGKLRLFRYLHPLPIPVGFPYERQTSTR